jgi:hypothetical protein
LSSGNIIAAGAINKRLATLLKNRTSDGVAGQRRKLEYKLRVVSLVKELEQKPFQNKPITEDPKVKTHWSDNEVMLMMEIEVQAIVDKNDKDINLLIHEKLPHRTSSAIKSKRKLVTYQEEVQRRVQRIRDQLTDGISVIREPPDHNKLQVIDAIVNLSEEARIKKDSWVDGNLLQAVEMIKQGKVNEAHEFCSMFAKNIFAEKKVIPKTKNKRKFGKPKNKRAARREEYAIIQKNYKKDEARCAKSILDGNWHLDSDRTDKFSTEQLLGTWNGILGAEALIDTRECIRKGEEFFVENMPISVMEIVNTVKKMGKTAPGPDGLKPTDISEHYLVLAVLFNIFQITAKIPKELIVARTILIPKSKNPESPSDYRPISISSVVTRVYHAILASRLEHKLVLNSRQKGFRRCDGVSENIHLLEAIIDMAKRGKKPLSIAFIDLRKAFDSVSHDSIIRGIKRQGGSEHLCSYIRHLYDNSSTTLFGENIECKRGVRQGDPLSPLLFNTVIDEAIDSLPNDIGFKVGNANVNCLAFADDMVIVAESPSGLKLLLQTCLQHLNDAGLELNHSKCAALIIKVDTHKKKYYFGSDTIKIHDDIVPTMSALSKYKYLGIGISGKTQLETTKVDMERMLKEVDKAPLKPHQRVKILKRYMLPRLSHRLVLGRVNKSTLKMLDKLINSYVRKWLFLPKDCLLAFLNARVGDGGLGIPSLSQLIPILKTNRTNSLKDSVDEVTIALCKTPYISKLIKRWGNGQVNEGILVLDKEDLNRVNKKKLYGSKDGGGLRFHCQTPSIHNWVDNYHGNAKLYVNAIKIRGNLVGTKTRCNRGRDSTDYLCRAGCNRPESLSHILQGCPRTHAVRIQRHNRANNMIRALLERYGFEIWDEPHLPIGDTFRKPDLIVKKGDRTVIIDTQIISDQYNIEEEYTRKCGWYNSKEILKEARKLTSNELGLIETMSLTLNWRGAISSRALINLKTLGISVKDLRRISRRVVEDGHDILRCYLHRTERV